MGRQLSTGSCRHRWLPGPAPSPPGRQAAFPQPRSLKSNPSFQLQLQRARGPALPGDPAACRSHGQGIFPVRCSRRAEPTEQRAERARRLSSPSLPPAPHRGKGKPTKAAPLHTPIWGQRRSGEQKPAFPGNQDPGGTGSRSFLSSSSSPARRKLTCTVPDVPQSTRGWRRGHSQALQGVELGRFQYPAERLAIKEQSGVWCCSLRTQPIYCCWVNTIIK